MNSQELRNLQEAYMEVYTSPEQTGEFELWVDSLLEEGYDLSDYTWDEMYEFYLDEAEGSYGQTPRATKAYGELAARRRNTPAREFKKGEKGTSVKSAQKHFSRTQNPDAGNRGRRSSMPRNPGRRGMTQQYRDYARGESEYGHVGYDPGHHGGPSAPGSKPKGKKLERQRKTGVSESYDLYDIILSHLLDEGYAETPEAAEVIMVNMSEEWRYDIINEGLANLVGKVSAGVKDVKDRFTGKKELLGGKHGYIKVGSPSKPGDRRVSDIGPVGTYSRSSASNTSNRGPARTMFMTADGNPR